MSILGAASLAGGAAKPTTASTAKAANVTALAGAAATAKPAAKPATTAAAPKPTSTVSAAKVGPSLGTTVHHNSSSKTSSSSSSSSAPKASTPAVNKTISEAGKAAAGAAAPAVTASNAPAASGGVGSIAGAGTAVGQAAAPLASPSFADAINAYLARSGGPEVRVLVAANDAKPPLSDDPPGGDFPDVKLRLLDPIQPVTGLPGPDIEVRDIGSLGGVAGFMASAMIVAQSANEEPAAPAPLENKPAHEAQSVSKVVPNPWGKLGGPAHRAGVAAAVKEMEQKYRTDQTAQVRTEVRVETPGGEKKVRYLDVGVLAGEPRDLVEGIQVGRAMANGVPISRERRGMADVDGARPEVQLGFRDYTKADRGE